MMRTRHAFPILLCLTLAAALFGAATPARAIEFERNDQLHITNLHRINDDLYAFGGNLKVDGVIDGDLAGFASIVRLAGTVTGTASLFASDVDISGQIDGSLRVFALQCQLDGTVGHSALLMGWNLTIGPSAVIERSAAIFGDSVEILGSIGGGPNRIDANAVAIEGSVGGDLKINAKHIIIGAAAVINGDLTYTTRTEADITIEDGAVIAGTVKWSPPEKKESTSTTTSVVLAVSKLLAAYLFGVIILVVFRRYAEESFRQIRTRFTVSLASGVVSLLALAFVIAVLTISIILVIAGLIVSNPIISAMLLVFSILMIPITTFSTVAGGIIFYSGKIVVGFLIGALLLRRSKTDAALNKINLLIGLALLTILFEIPYIGFAVYLLVAITGAGAIVLGIRYCPRNLAHTAPPTQPTAPSAPTPPIPPQPPLPGPPPPEPPPRPGDIPGTFR